MSLAGAASLQCCPGMQGLQQGSEPCFSSPDNRVLAWVLTLRDADTHLSQSPAREHWLRGVWGPLLPCHLTGVLQ
ncbi:hypothetical protein E2C01_026105 [Portunus trituberculatus]|uniref:Uncharacterized protein n=1 Tax=Portunus trituberculatus TaxID=210409 RepID=A0A5B7EHH6_PORTR|nr:hypothetical protein [Portunus trituberculatus]